MVGGGRPRPLRWEARRSSPCSVIESDDELQSADRDGFCRFEGQALTRPGQDVGAAFEAPDGLAVLPHHHLAHLRVGAAAVRALHGECSAFVSQRRAGSDVLRYLRRDEHRHRERERDGYVDALRGPGFRELAQDQAIDELA